MPFGNGSTGEQKENANPFSSTPSVPTNNSGFSSTPITFGGGNGNNVPAIGIKDHPPAMNGFKPNGMNGTPGFAPALPIGVANSFGGGGFNPGTAPVAADSGASARRRAAKSRGRRPR
jgi:hypothetical protein